MSDSIWTRADIDALKVAVANVVLTVHYDGPPGRSVTYQSLGDMERLLAKMVQQVGDAAGTRSPYRRVATRKGL